LNKHHIIHDTDRDGWGSAALLLSSLGPENCKIYPTGEKDIRKLLGSLQPEPTDNIWVLDIPAPPSWTGLELPKCSRLVWVDHHLAAWQNELPHGIEVHLPDSERPTTTMHMLIDLVLVKSSAAKEFATMICSDSGSSGWGAVFDGLSEEYPNVPIAEDDLRKHLAVAVAGVPVPNALGFALKKTESTRSTVQEVLDSAETRCLDNLVIIRVDEAHRIPLSRYSLAAGRQHPGKSIVLVHRKQRLYCGRDSSKPGFDFLRHFKSRGLDPKGHAYVCTVPVPVSQIEEEVDMLVATMKPDIEEIYTDSLKQTAFWAKRIRDELQPILDSHPGQVHFRPSAGGVAMIGLNPKLPQRGRSGFRNLVRVRKNFDELYGKYCLKREQGRSTPEKALQSFLIREAYQNGRKMRSINAASRGTDDPVELIFAVDEIPVLRKAKPRMVCDLLALRKTSNEEYRPVLLELKSDRMMKRLVDQVEGYAGVVDRHFDLFGDIFSALLGEQIRLIGKCEKWIVWPMAGDTEDPRQEEFAKKNIRVVGYERKGSDFLFRIGQGVYKNT